MRAFSAEAAHAYILYCVFRSGTIRKSVRAVDEKQDIFPCCGLIYCMLNWLKCHLVKYYSLIKTVTNDSCLLSCSNGSVKFSIYSQVPLT